MTTTDSIQAQLTSMQMTGQTKTPSASMGKDDFLKLLVQQLRFQDPMNPLKGTEFAAQLAQFSSVEQLSNINTQLSQNLNANAALSASINNALAATFIGKDVRAATDSFQYSGSGDVNLGFSLGSAAETASVRIYDAYGNLVKILASDGSKGDNTLKWDGKNANGSSAAKGKYSFEVVAKDSNGNSMDAKKYVFGNVTGVRFKTDGTFFVIDGLEISLANILEILKEG